MNSRIKLIYGYDPLCGWCYGFVPTLVGFSKAYPNVDIEVVPGGLFSDERIQPYTQMVDYIYVAFNRIKQTTGQYPNSSAFFDMIASPETGLINSAPPTHALMQVKAHSPDKQVAFAHQLQLAHFDQGLSFNNPLIYQKVSQEVNTQPLDIDAILSATDDNALVHKSYSQAADLGINSYPTCIIVNQDDLALGNLDGIYNTNDFIEAFSTLTNH